MQAWSLLLLGAATATAADPHTYNGVAVPILDRSSAIAVLRTRRKNSGFFEELKDGNFDNECIQEMCSREELDEIYPDDATKNPPHDEALRQEKWDELTLACHRKPCNAQGTRLCVQTWNKRTCECKKGYHAANDDCEDSNECDDPTSCPGEGKTCVNSEGSFECNCKTGFEEQEGGVDCVDVDECKDENICAEGQVCKNTDGGFSCECKEGYAIQDDSGACTDIDECAEGDTLCGENSVCENTDGSHVCKCAVGYSEGFMGGCTDDDECLTLPCGMNSDCANNEGSYTCTCEEGYAASRGDAGDTCEDVDECENGTDDCEASDICENTPGSFICRDACSLIICDPFTQECVAGKCECTATGFIMNNDNECEDLDECATGVNDCSNGETCKNTVGSFVCIATTTTTTTVAPTTLRPVTVSGCDIGFASDDITGECQNIDECQTNNGGCPVYCMDFWGSFLCYDDLKKEKPLCHHMSIRVPETDENPSGIQCKCHDGYELCQDGFSCVALAPEYLDNGPFKAAGIAGPSCPQGQFGVESECYSASESPATYADACEACADQDASVAKITSKNQWWVVGKNIGEGFASFWIHPSSDSASSDMTVFGNGGKLVANLPGNMASVPPQWNQVSVGVHHYACVHDGGVAGCGVFDGGEPGPVDIQTDAPTTDATTTEEPSTVAPTTVDPTTVAPTTNTDASTQSYPISTDPYSSDVSTSGDYGSDYTENEYGFK